MPTREELETRLGKAMADLAEREGHLPRMPKDFVGGDSDESADALLLHMQQRPPTTLKGLAAELKLSVSDTRRRLSILTRRGDVHYARIKLTTQGAYFLGGKK